MKPSDEGGIVQVMAEWCQSQNETPSREEAARIAGQCRSGIEQWRQDLPHPNQGPQINARNCMRAKAEG